MVVTITDSIRAWKVRSDKQQDLFVKFFVLYMSVDAWIGTQGRATSDRGKIEWLKSDKSELKKYWEDSGYKNPSVSHSLKEFRDVKTIENMSPLYKKKYPSVDFTSTSDFNQLIEFIYQIRCNLFHGDKDPRHFHDQRVVFAGVAILEDWISWILQYS